MQLLINLNYMGIFAYSVIQDNSSLAGMDNVSILIKCVMAKKIVKMVEMSMPADS